MDYKEKKYFVDKIREIARYNLGFEEAEKTQVLQKMRDKVFKILWEEILKEKEKVWSYLEKREGLTISGIFSEEGNKFKFTSGLLDFGIPSEILERLEERISKILEEVNREIEFFNSNIRTIIEKREEICDRIMAGESVGNFKALQEEMDLATL